MRFLAWGVNGFVTAAIGFPLFTWQYWALIATVMAIVYFERKDARS